MKTVRKNQLSCFLIFTSLQSTTAGCDADYGWLPGVDGSGKCYMLVKDYKWVLNYVMLMTGLSCDDDYI